MSPTLQLLLLLGVCATIATAAPRGTEESENEILERNTRQAGGCDCYAWVYDHPNFGGRSLLIRQQNGDFSSDWFDNRTESAIITGTCSWIFYESEKFNHDTLFLSASHILRPGTYTSAASWGGPGNHISSARALPPSGTTALALFEHDNYDGRMTVLYGSSSHHPAVEFDDAVSSAIVFGGTWRLCREFSYQGTYSEIREGEYPYLTQHFCLTPLMIESDNGLGLIQQLPTVNTLTVTSQGTH